MLGRSIFFGDINGDGYEDIAIGAMYYSSYTGRVYIVHGTAAGIPGGSVSAIASTIFTGEGTTNDLGRSVVVGDINGDGYADIAMGADYYNNQQGQVYIFYGSAGGITTPANIATEADVVLTGAAISNRFGYSLAMGDINRDGCMDLGVGASRVPSNYIGRAYVYLGSGSGLITPAHFDQIGAGTWYYMGYGIGFCDMNGDGYTDFIASEHGYSSMRGQVHIFNGSSSGISWPPSATVSGGNAGDYFGKSITP